MYIYFIAALWNWLVNVNTQKRITAVEWTRSLGSLKFSKNTPGGSAMRGVFQKLLWVVMTVRRGRRWEDLGSEKNQTHQQPSETVHFLGSRDSCIFLPWRAQSIFLLSSSCLMGLGRVYANAGFILAFLHRLCVQAKRLKRRKCFYLY